MFVYSYYKGDTVVRPSYLSNGNPYAGKTKTTYLYWDVHLRPNSIMDHSTTSKSKNVIAFCPHDISTRYITPTQEREWVWTLNMLFCTVWICKTNGSNCLRILGVHFQSALETPSSWWRRNMGTFFILLSLWEGELSVTCDTSSLQNSGT